MPLVGTVMAIPRAKKESTIKRGFESWVALEKLF